VAGQPAPRRIIVPFTGQVIGEGFDSTTVERAGTALDVANTGEDPQAEGQSAVFKFQILTSQSSLERALNINAEVDARYGLFSGGGTFDFAEQSALNSTSTYIVASCLVTNALRFGTGFTANAAAKRVIDSADLDAFARAFGDRFTQSLHTGGEFYALVRVTSSSITHQQRIAASLHAELNGLTAALSFKAAMEMASKDAESHTEVEIQVRQNGGLGSQLQIPGTEADRLREHMNTFAGAVHQHAIAYRAELVTYDVLALDFPSPQAIEDRREVLEDCLAQRQQLWSEISDLRFAQTPDAALIFSDLPPAQELVNLENACRRVLNNLLDHARAVSTGAVPPTFFVPEGKPALPTFKRRMSGSFATWWARHTSHDATLLRDEVLLIEDIGRAVRPRLSVPLESAPPEAVERAAELLTGLGLNGGSDHLQTPRHQSLAALPQMLSAPLTGISGSGMEFTDLTGLESFPRLEALDLVDGRLQRLDAIVALGGLRSLSFWANGIQDLGPLRGLTELRSLELHRNQIEDIGPLTGLADLEEVTLSSNRIDQIPSLRGMTSLSTLHLNNYVNGRDEELTRNTFRSARGLADVPRLASALTSHDRLHLEFVGLAAGDKGRSASATRVGDSLRFDFITEDPGADLHLQDQFEIEGIFEWLEPQLFPEALVVTALRFSTQTGIVFSSPGDLQGSLGAGEAFAMFQKGQNLESFNQAIFQRSFAQGFNADPPLVELFIHVTAA
jgi:hypothetical protein